MNDAGRGARLKRPGGHDLLDRDQDLPGGEDAAQVEPAAALDLDVAVCVGALGVQEKDIERQRSRRADRQRR